jgi:hypothetical protein
VTLTFTNVYDSRYAVFHLSGPECDDGMPLSGCASWVAAAGGSFAASTPTNGSRAAHDFTVLTVSPECPSGVVLLGEREKTVAVSPSRFAAANCTAAGIYVRLHPSLPASEHPSSPGESVTVAVGIGGKVVGFTLVQPVDGQGAVGLCTADGASCVQKR